MFKPIINNVCLSSTYKRPAGGRWGTAHLSIEGFAKKFGDPHAQNFSKEGLDGAGKVHAVWTVDTPRGPVEIGDYWWNPKDQLSIRTSTKWAALWAIKWLRIQGVKAN